VLSLARIAPGLAALRDYKLNYAARDINAGLAVAAVAIPVSIAYAGLAGLTPETGLYSTLLPLLAYAAFGSSRQLIIGPDAATCAVIAASVAPLSIGDPSAYTRLSATLALLTGFMCIGASFLRLGMLADFLSRPILVGFLNGVAVSIIFGQADKILGFPVQGSRIFPRLIDICGKLGETHLLTLAVAAGTFFIIVMIPRLVSWLPSTLIGMMLAGIAVPFFGLQAAGVKTIGAVAGGLPTLSFPYADITLLPSLVAEAAGLALVSFTSMILTARSFAAKNGYDIDPDQDFAALGVANVVSALSQGFAVSGADSRTAVSNAAGGRTHAVGLVAAIVVGLVLIFLTPPLRYVPIPALGAVLVAAGLSLIDIASLRLIYRIDPAEGLLSMLAMLGVIAAGPINGILLVVVLALLRFIKLMSRPSVEILGKVKGFPGLHSIKRHDDSESIPGLLLFRFNAPIMFFNAPYFRRELMRAVDQSGPSLRHVVIDLLPASTIDATGILTILDLVTTLKGRGISLNAAGRATEWRLWANKRGVVDGRVRFFPTLRQAIRELSNKQYIG
jgi:high affinity sulfate transporter 1